MKKLALAAICLTLVALTASGAFANPIPPQVTLSSSSVGALNFADSAGVLSFWFTGTAAQCGHANCISGNALLDPQLVTGKYWMWLVGGTPTISGGPSDYTVNMGLSTIFLDVKLGPGGNGSLGDLVTTVSLTDLFGGTSRTPLISGTFAASTSTVMFLSDFSPSATGTIDFTVNLGNRPKISSLLNHQQTSGFLSSGEAVPDVPEPSTLALMGTGVLGLAGMVRRKLKI